MRRWGRHSTPEGGAEAGSTGALWGAWVESRSSFADGNPISEKLDNLGKTC